MIGILPISSKLPFITVEVLHNHGLMDCLRFDLGTSIAMLSQAILKIRSTPVPLASYVSSDFRQILSIVALLLNVTPSYD